MSIPATKLELEVAIQDAFSKLEKDYASIPADCTRLLKVEGNIKDTQISVCDTLAYLIGWGHLVMKWHSRKQAGETVDFPETGFRWNQLGELAVHFHQTYRDWSYDALLEEWRKVVTDILVMIASENDASLYVKPWYKQWTLGRMIQFNTSSPMKNMRTKVRRFKKSHAIK
ncbi:ClbS/DfsB family four-helix bundle protein [Enterovibrio sp. ZSDZ35]|uniref:ClbS/DfsB family four-helix bundle protein n=1 Tax=Enterovibrio qingdaonensis TaxID=2899818 RepID=A0ABT5QJA2_9GAMM|nr:ClbS/DfsB family four-helix bundle protein [Enterovibrio sp. ZSDZ35]MDD1781071.1 ClbS/DfsB family four-helix bundle protein [Enterovibrio sp. ZSDZ35]